MIITSDIHVSSIKGTPSLLDQIEKSVLEDRHKTLIVAGDVTCGGKTQEYSHVYQWFEGLLEKGVNIVITPGNHDTSQSLWLFRVKVDDREDRYSILADMIAEQSIVVDRRDEYDMVYAIGEDVFFSARSTHHKAHHPTRIKRKQFEWAKSVLKEHGLTKKDGYRLHLLTHQSLWKLEGDSHGHMHRRKRLVYEFLQPMGFVTAINGHNHGFRSGHRKVKDNLPFTLYHIQAPTASEHKSKGGKCKQGYVKWDPEIADSAELVT